MLIILLGMLVGVVLGLTGAGGGILAIPALTLGLGWTLAQATPVALLAVGTAAALGALDGLRKGLVRYKAAALMALIGSITSPLGLYLAKLLPAKVLVLLFGAVMVFVSGRMFWQARADAREDASESVLEKNCMLNPSTGRLTWNARCSMTLVSIGATSGLLTGLLSVGGGFLIVPAFRKFSDVRIHAVVSTSLMVVALEGGFAIPAERGSVHYEAEISVLIGKPLSNNPSAEEVLDAISGFAPGLDLTLRDKQSELKAKGLPWEVAKSFDGACVLAPFVPSCTFPDVTDIGIRLTINGEVRQDGNSAQMLNPIVPMIQYMAGCFSLQAGDVILTGTPAGVGPLNVGDELVLELAGVNRFESTVR